MRGARCRSDYVVVLAEKKNANGGGGGFVSRQEPITQTTTENEPHHITLPEIAHHSVCNKISTIRAKFRLPNCVRNCFRSACVLWCVVLRVLFVAPIHKTMLQMLQQIQNGANGMHTACRFSWAFSICLRMCGWVIITEHLNTLTGIWAHICLKLICVYGFCLCVACCSCLGRQHGKCNKTRPCTGSALQTDVNFPCDRYLY